HVCNVCGTVKFRYSFTNQNPPSLTCDRMSEPAPIATTSNSTFVPGVWATMGARMPAAVEIATVAEPVATRISAATNQPSNNGDRWVPFPSWGRPPPTPLAPTTLLTPPPAPTTKRMLATGARQSLLNFNIWSFPNPRAKPNDQNEKSTATNIATTGL